MENKSKFPYRTKHCILCSSIFFFFKWAVSWETGVWKTAGKLRQYLLSSPTLVLKSGGSVLAPVRRLTRKAFQFEYLCCMPARRSTQTMSSRTWALGHNAAVQPHSLFGGTRGLPLEAHQPTGCTSGIHRLHQKSLLVSLSKPSYLRRALNPEHREKQISESKITNNMTLQSLSVTADSGRISCFTLCHSSKPQSLKIEVCRTSLTTRKYYWNHVHNFVCRRTNTFFSVLSFTQEAICVHP